MMSVTRQTQNWSKAPQETSLSTDSKEVLSADEKQKYFNNEDVGEVLNKAADANWVDPEKKPRAVGNSSLDKDAFLKLLLTQMKNQDPTNPLKSHEMSAQLAQFTSLEKLTNIDESIKGLRKEQQPSQNYESLNLIGKIVSGDSSKVLRMDANETHPIRFQLKNDAAKIKVEIKDGNGQIVRNLEFNNLKAGRNEISWNGQLEDGTPARVGEYQLTIDAKDAFGKKVWSETRFEGAIDGLTFTPTGPLLMVGKQQIRMSDVERIVAAPQMPQQAPTTQLQSLPSAPTAAPVGSSTKNASKPENKPAPTHAAGNSVGLDELGMSSGLMNKLKKEGAL